MATKPTKQQTAQAKARAGGNNPIKVTNSGLKKLGSAALLAASFTPVGRSVKIAATVAKAAKGKTVAAKTLKARQKIDTEAIAARSVRIKSKEVKPIVLKKRPTVIKPKPNPPNPAKTQFKNDSSRTRASDRAMKEYEKNVIRHGERPTDPSFGSKLAERAALNTKLKRKPNLKAK